VGDFDRSNDAPLSDPLCGLRSIMIVVLTRSPLPTLAEHERREVPFDIIERDRLSAAGVVEGLVALEPP
jgi:hypothetical protein